MTTVSTVDFYAIVGRPDTCPAWCTVDHSDDKDPLELRLHLGDEHTDGTVRDLLQVHTGSTIDIRVARCDNPDEDTKGTPNLMVRMDLELTTWEQAAELARTILEAFSFVPRPGEDTDQR